jgi:hypothetical protein
MTATYDLIASTTLGSNTRTITFLSIPSTYRDLILVCNLSIVGGSDLICVTFNNNTSAYNTVTLEGAGFSGSGSQSNESNAKSSVIDYSVNDSPGSFVVQVFDYATTNKHKSVIMRGGSTNLRLGAAANVWANLAAINRLDVFTDSGTRTYAAGSSFNLYGVIS